MQLSAIEARKLSDEAYAPLQKILHAVETKIKEAASNGKTSFDCFEVGTFNVVDNYRHVPNPTQELLYELLVDLGYKVLIVREPIQNEVPGPCKDKVFLRIKW